MYTQQQLLSDVSLIELSIQSPILWDEALAEIKAAALTDHGAKLGLLRAKAMADLSRWQNAKATKIGDSSYAHDSLVKAKMLVLGIEQFTQVLSGQKGSTISIKDRLIFSKFVLPLLSRGILNVKEFDGKWSFIKNTAWAASQIQNGGIWSVPTLEFCKHVIHLAAGRRIIEIAAGKGLLTSGLRKLGAEVIGTDDFSWQPGRHASAHKSEVEKLSATDTLHKYKPSVVVCSWPPPDNGFEAEIFDCKSVQLYIAIVSTHKFASGNWQAYAASSKKFKCTVSQPFNLLLRPIELDQQALIFKRI